MIQQFQSSINELFAKMIGWADAIILLLPNILLAGLFLVFSLYVSRRLKKITQKAFSKSSANETTVGFLSNLAISVFMLIVLFVTLNILNLSEAVTALLGAAGVTGLAIGLALQTPLMNLFSGVLLSVRDHYRVGDFVATNGFLGKIQKINLRSTILLTPDGQEVVIPNKDVLESPIKNYSHNTLRRIEINCGVAYGDDLRRVKKVAISAIQNSKLEICSSHPVELFFTDFGDSSVNFSLHLWLHINKQVNYLAMKSEAIVVLKDAFDKNGITIPYPIRTLDFGMAPETGSKADNHLAMSEMVKGQM